jgi:hypothetical protein
MVGDSGFGWGSLLLAGVGGLVLGKWMARWETTVDRGVVADELERTVVGLRTRAQTTADHKELDEALRGIEDLRAGRIPFESRESFVDKCKATLGGMTRKLNPWAKSGNGAAA